MVEFISFDKPPTAMIKEVLVKELASTFGFNINDRVRVVSDVEKFTRDDPGVWAQSKKKRPHYFESYWDNVWICDFDSTTSPDVAAYRFLVGFKNAFTEGQVTLHTPEEYTKEKQRILAEDLIQAEIKKLEQEKAVGQEQAIAKQAIKEVLEDKKEQKKKVRKKMEAKYGY